MKTVEYKIDEQGKAWEDIQPATCTFPCDMAAEAVETHFQVIADRRGKQVRWNWKGLGQGHYISPRKSGG